MLTYTTPRTEAVIENWPSGSRRVTARFYIETHATRGQRCGRTTTGAAKYTPYAKAMRIVDGSDGRIYVIADNGSYGFVTVWRSNLSIHEETIRPGNARYDAVVALFGER
jgi:hypothetical protein